jgi:hypothetical protein
LTLDVSTWPRGQHLPCAPSRYDVSTGRLTFNPETGVASYPVEVVDGRIMVAIEKKCDL